MKIMVNGAVVYAYTGTRPRQAADPTLVFVHGAAHDHSVWALQSRYFAHHGWNVLALDLPGHGRSAGDALPTIEALADWLPAVLDAVGAGSAALIGHSMGALVTLQCAARYPGRVAHLALLGPAAPMEVSDVLLEAATHDEHMAYELINGWSFSPGKQLGGNQVPGMWMTGNALRLLERAHPSALATDLMACRRYLGGLEAAAAVRCPALLIVAGRDLMAPAKGAVALAQRIPHREVITLPGSGHALMAEEPDAVLEALKGFLAIDRAR
ncbi:MAG: alpha/beta hydrolase [Betaproteobacteria bacterium]